MQKFMLAFMKNISNLIPRGSGGIGRRDGLKIHWPLKAVRVRVPPSLPKTKKTNFKTGQNFALKVDDIL